MLAGTFASGSDAMVQSSLLSSKKGVYVTRASCYLVGIEKKYLGITYTLSHCVTVSVWIVQPLSTG